MFTKSGIMVGLGEDRQAVLQVMDDMRAADVDFLTIGQYLQPTPKHHRVDRFVTPEEFAAYETAAWGKGFLMVSATPLTRSSYHAGDDFARLRAARPGCAPRPRGWAPPPSSATVEPAKRVARRVAFAAMGERLDDVAALFELGRRPRA
jgi:hypothetical protein